MVVETERLLLTPMRLEQMRRWVHDPMGTARELGAVAPELGLLQRFSARRIYQAKITLMEDTPQQWWLSTYFQMIRRQDRQIVGELGFKGLVHHQEAEIGYGTHPPYQNQGYMTEAVTALSDWALRQREIPLARITARTREENYASQRVLQHSGFSSLYLSCGIYHWSKERK